MKDTVAVLRPAPQVHIYEVVHVENIMENIIINMKCVSEVTTLRDGCCEIGFLLLDLAETCNQWGSNEKEKETGVSSSNPSTVTFGESSSSCGVGRNST